MPVTEITTSAQFTELLNDTQSHQYLFVDFFAEWCGPCKKIAPIIDKLSEIYNSIAFVKIDVDKCQELSVKYEVSAMPTFLILKTGEPKPTTVIVGADQKKIEYALKMIAGQDQPGEDF
jgi:thioredoxin 1